MKQVLIELTDDNFSMFQQKISDIGIVNVNDFISTEINKALDLYFSQADSQESGK